MSDIRLKFDISAPDGWTERETNLVLVLTDRGCKLKMAEMQLAALIEAVSAGDDFKKPSEAAFSALNYAAIQAGIDEVNQMFPGVQVWAIP